MTSDHREDFPEGSEDAVDGGDGGVAGDVQFLHVGIDDGLEFLLPLLVLLLRVVEPLEGILELLLVSGFELVGELLVVHRVSEVVGIRFQTILSSDTSSGSIVPGLVDHTLDVLLGEAAIVVVMVMWFDFPVVLSEAEAFKIPLASMSNVTSTWGTLRGAGDTGELELPEKVVVLMRKGWGRCESG